jgi:homoserine O-acetyltransferase
MNGRRAVAWTVAVIGTGAALFVWNRLAPHAPLRIASLGDFRLESGEIIRDCKLGYRVLGRLNDARSNAVLVAPWYQGKSGPLSRQIAPHRLVDPSKYFVIVIDALGNGVSTSPSNSTEQAGSRFPQFTMRDIVESQYRLLTEQLQVKKLHAVVGVSMGGMQALQWASGRPDFVGRAVSIVATPQSQPDDRARWQVGLDHWRISRWARTRAALAQWKPRTALEELWLDPFNRTRQAQAIMSHDIAMPHGGSLERAAAAIRTKLMIVTTREDAEVNPAPAFEFARLTGATLLELDGRCGHQAPSCERATMWPAVREFLDR